MGHTECWKFSNILANTTGYIFRVSMRLGFFLDAFSKGIQ
jgi:hypothetical protein